MKQQEATRYALGDYNFYIRPLPAMTAANMTGDLSALIGPILGGLAPLLNMVGEDGKSFMDTDLTQAAPVITGAFSSLSGDKLERLLRKLLIESKNITFEGIDDDKPQRLDQDTVNEIFCGNVQDMFILAFKVIQINFSGFFEKFADQFGKLGDLVQKLQAQTL